MTVNPFKYTQYGRSVRLQRQLQLNIKPTIHEVFLGNVSSGKITTRETSFRGKKPSGESKHPGNDRIPSQRPLRRAHTCLLCRKQQRRHKLARNSVVNTLSIGRIHVGVCVYQLFDHSFHGQSRRQYQRSGSVVHLRVHFRRTIPQQNLQIMQITMH